MQKLEFLSSRRTKRKLAHVEILAVSLVLLHRKRKTYVSRNQLDLAVSSPLETLTLQKAMTDFLREAQRLFLTQVMSILDPKVQARIPPSLALVLALILVLVLVLVLILALIRSPNLDRVQVASNQNLDLDLDLVLHLTIQSQVIPTTQIILHIILSVLKPKIDLTLQNLPNRLKSLKVPEKIKRNTRTPLFVLRLENPRMMISQEADPDLTRVKHPDHPPVHKNQGLDLILNLPLPRSTVLNTVRSQLLLLMVQFMVQFMVPRLDLMLVPRVLRVPDQDLVLMNLVLVQVQKLLLVHPLTLALTVDLALDLDHPLDLNIQVPNRVLNHHLIQDQKKGLGARVLVHSLVLNNQNLVVREVVQVQVQVQVQLQVPDQVQVQVPALVPAQVRAQAQVQVQAQAQAQAQNKPSRHHFLFFFYASVFRVSLHSQPLGETLSYITTLSLTVINSLLVTGLF